MVEQGTGPGGGEGEEGRVLLVVLRMKGEELRHLVIKEVLSVGLGVMLLLL